VHLIVPPAPQIDPRAKAAPSKKDNVKALFLMIELCLKLGAFRDGIKILRAPIILKTTA